MELWENPFISIKNGVVVEPNGAYKSLEDHDKLTRAKVIDEIKKILPPIYCNNCNQIACDGGRVGSIQECASVRLLIDVLGELEEQLKENE